MRTLTCSVFLLACSLAVAADPSRSGSISGTVERPESVTSIVAINRSNDKKHPGKLDTKTGRFTIGELPLAATYDCIVDFGGARLEGINLMVPRSDYEEEQPLSIEDVAILKKKMHRLNKFEDIVDILEIRGNIQYAAILVNKLRTRPFFDSKPGEVIWRAELWRFERPEETWVMMQDDLFLVLYRERIQRREYNRKSLTFDPRLGGLKLTKKQPTADLGRVKPPLAKAGIRFRSDQPAGKAEQKSTANR